MLFFITSSVMVNRLDEGGGILRRNGEESLFYHGMVLYL